VPTPTNNGVGINGFDKVNVMQSKEIGEKILKRTPFGTRVEGVDVHMTIGEKAVRMDYQTALKLSAFLRHAGRLAKRNAGDQARNFTVYADLTDANADELLAQLSRDRTSVFAKVG
jgi:hypothetical protein